MILRIRLATTLTLMRLAQWFVVRKEALVPLAHPRRRRGRHSPRQKKRAQRRLATYFDKNPKDVDGWVLLGASQSAEPERLILELQPAFELARTTPILAMMLSIAYARLGQQKHAVEWANHTKADAILFSRLIREPAFMKVRAGRFVPAP